ncbi:oxidoreductase [Altererythrobacter sp. B11]|uniref:Gfo/Idh/MocA family protein n=1 Tax=Altererythrobacter sp. B11 TaxID=2060312 RepID=UPI000DC6D2AE|nr:Gfo/Idh/MocA family oxidoreductase [Altererythrobacter sp. B11]BBC70967.1 oxidoreductase [Altererythrobacter sp. B11]
MIQSEVPGVVVVGLGKMGISHLAIANASRHLRVVGVCDSSSLVGQGVERYCGIRFIKDYNDVIAMPEVDAVIIATPTRVHDMMVSSALEARKHVFCEKPMTLSAAASRALADTAEHAGLVGQVGYHNRFVGTFGEAKRLIDLGVIGRVRHVHAEAYGPVVLRPTAATWRSDPKEGGGCLYDYAAHPVNLMNWYVGAPIMCGGAELPQQYSTGVEDAVYANLTFPNGVTGQVSVNWSDETMRKMTTRVTVYGDGGKIIVDRQELMIYVGATGKQIDGYGEGWTVRNITELTENVDYYLRGEEYSAQIDAFGRAITQGNGALENGFASAAQTDLTLEMIRAAASAERVHAEYVPAEVDRSEPVRRRRGLLAKVIGR